MPRRHCPVCRTGWILRADIKTCSPRCSAEWRNWSPERRSAAEDKAARPLEILTFEQIAKIRDGLRDGSEEPSASGRVGAPTITPPTIEPAKPTEPAEEPDFDSIIGKPTTRQED